MSNAVVSWTTPQTPLIDKATGQLSFPWTKWFQGIQQAINGAFDQQGNFDGNLGASASIATRDGTLLFIIHNIDDAGVVKANGIDFSRAYLNKDTDHINDGSGSPLAGGQVAFAAMVASLPANGQILVFNGTHWLPAAKASTIAEISHEWLNGYDATTGLFTQTQPAFADISGVAVVAQIPNLPESQITGLTSNLAAKAPLASPTFTGRVGIETVSPGGRLSVDNDSADGTSDYTKGLVFQDSFSGTGPWAHAAIWTVGSSGFNGNLIFGTDGDGVENFNPTEKMRILANGNVGVGTSTPHSPLAVVGVPVYANNAAAITGGLAVGDFYQDGADPSHVCVVR